MAGHIPSRAKWLWLLRSLKLFFVPLALSCLCYFAWNSRDLVVVVIINAHAGYLVVAIVIWAMLHLISPIFVITALNGCGANLSYQTALNIHVRNLPARYLPGGIWHTVGRLMDFNKIGVKADQLASFVLLENMIAAAVTLMLGGGCVWYFRGIEGWGGVAAFGATGGLGALLVMPVVIGRYKRFAGMSYEAYVGSVGVVVFFWAVAATAFIFYLYSFPSVTGSASILEIGGTYLFSWGIGYIAIFAPQGIGVFEVVAGGMLKGILTLGGAVTVVAGFRIIVLLADSIVWVIHLLIRSRLSQIL